MNNNISNNDKISNYDPIEDIFSNKGNVLSYRENVRKIEDNQPDVIEDLFNIETTDESLKKSLNLMSEDFSNILTNNVFEPIFFKSDVIENDLYNIKTQNTEDRVVDFFNNFELYYITPESLKDLEEPDKTSNNDENTIEERSLILKKADVRENPDEVAWAVNNRALVRFKTNKDNKEIFSENDVEEENTDNQFSDMQVDQKIANILKNKKIKTITVYDEKGQLQRDLNANNINVVEFTAAETEFISKIAFAAIHASYRLKEKEKERKSANQLLLQDRNIFYSVIENNVNDKFNKSESNIQLEVKEQKQTKFVDDIKLGDIKSKERREFEDEIKSEEGKIINKKQEEKKLTIRKENEKQEELNKTDKEFAYKHVTVKTKKNDRPSNIS